MDKPLSDPAAQVKACGARGLNPQHQLVEAELVKSLHAEGLFVLPWTVDESRTIQQLVRLGVDGICSNDVSTLVRFLS
ncbi:MAG: glycerophosphodiester phosphodiesterase [Candidatus Riflebacteria bacterium]|nr:glycerophosphodiester phosphodiesterase [Candidatus Riflebacteria bacterium]